MQGQGEAQDVTAECQRREVFFSPDGSSLEAAPECEKEQPLTASCRATTGESQAAVKQEVEETEDVSSGTRCRGACGGV